MSMREVRKQNCYTITEVIHVLKRRKNKEGVSKEERLKEVEE
jgi:hypothetical protein